MKTKILVTFMVFSIIGIGFTYWHLQTKPDKTMVNDTSKRKAHAPSSVSPSSTASPVSSPSSGKSVPKTAYLFNDLSEYEKMSKYGKLPSIFKGTNYFAKLSDADGNLMITRDLLILFKYFFLALDEEGIETVTGRIREYLQLALQGKAADQALAIFEDYLGYREALIKWKSSYDSTADKLAMFDELKALRRKYFSPEVVAAFFREEEAEIEYALKSRQIQSDDSLSEEQKEEMYTELEQQLPEHEREQIRRQRKEKELNAKIKKLEAEGGKTEEIYQLRKEFYGTVTAKRMTFLDDFSDEWKSKVDEYNQVIEKIKANPDLTDAEKEELVKQTTLDTFTKDERVKLVYYNMKQKQ
jgi:lipase chaperone LimK